MINSGQGTAAATDIIDQFSRGVFPKEIFFAPGNPGYTAAWQQTVDAAEKYNAPGKFTAFIGYEWTSQVPPGNNLHRVVIYRDGADKTRDVEPFTTYPPAGSTTPEDLWKVLQAYQDKTGGQVLAIAHNGNLSNGMMFPLGHQSGDQAAAHARLRRNPHALGAAVRSHPDEGRRRDRIPTSRQRMSSAATSSGTSSTST